MCLSDNRRLIAYHALMWRFAFGIGLLIAGICGVIAWQSLPPELPMVFTVEARIDGFYPAMIQIPRGSIVRFVSSVKRPFWPASNPHPTHTIHVPFDSLAPISPASHWDFTFTEEGRFTYHDHLIPEHGGVIIVGSDIDIASVTTKAGCDALSDGSRQACYVLLLKTTVEKKGLEAAYDVFRDISQSDAEGCHDYAHALGISAYTLYRSGADVQVDEVSSWCGWGFWHGFLTKLQTEEGFGSAKKFCLAQNGTDSIDTEHRRTNCFHGVGIGLIGDPPPYPLWGDAHAVLQPALAACDTATTDTSDYTANCYSGAYHSLILYMAQNRYAFELDYTDPFALCKGKNSAQELECALQIASKLGIVTDFDMHKTYGFLRSIRNAETRTQVSKIALSMFFKNHMTDAEMYATLQECIEINGELETCMYAMVQSLFDNGLPNEEYKRAIALCEDMDLSPREQTACFQAVNIWIQRTYSGVLAQEACAAITSQYKDLCRI